MSLIHFPVRPRTANGISLIIEVPRPHRKQGNILGIREKHKIPHFVENIYNAVFNFINVFPVFICHSFHLILVNFSVRQ